MARWRPPELMVEIVEQILLCIPPNDPAILVRAALVSKGWCRLIASHDFCRRYREIHGAPPLLGFIYNIRGIDSPLARLVPTSSFRPPCTDLSDCRVLHSGHGRVLLFEEEYLEMTRLLVWDPITDQQRELPDLLSSMFGFDWRWNAAVLCASTVHGCNHLDCHLGHFLVVLVASTFEEVVACVYSSEADAWSEPTFSEEQEHIGDFHLGTKAIVGNDFYVKYDTGNKVLKYNLATREISVIHLPIQVKDCKQRIALMATEDSRLGFAIVYGSRLYLWSKEDGPDREAIWATIRVTELEALLPAGAFSKSTDVICSTDGAQIIFIRTIFGYFTCDLKSGRIKTLGVGHGYGNNIVPFTSFLTPALRLANTDEGPGVDTSTT